MEVINHDAPTDWIKPPTLELKLANHTFRNTGKRNGDTAETGGAMSEVPTTRSVMREITVSLYEFVKRQ
jgi:hypothetical protein